jgi:hypothetical protein
MNACNDRQIIRTNNAIKRIAHLEKNGVEDMSDINCVFGEVELRFRELESKIDQLEKDIDSFGEEARINVM